MIDAQACGPGLALGTALALGANAAGVGLIRWAWRGPARWAATRAGWALLLAAVPAWAMTAAWDKAWALALLAPSLVAFAVLAGGLELRPARVAQAARAAVELPERSGEAVWRALVRTLYAGPLSGLAAMAIGAAWALRGAGSAADRMGVALLLSPALWAAGLVWSTTDPKLPRVGGGLGALALAGGLAAVL